MAIAVLIAYASKYGATRGIAERIGQKLGHMGMSVEVKPIGAVGDISYYDYDYDGFIIGSAVYSGSWLPEAAEFVRIYQDTLSMRPVWLFSSGPLGAKVATSAAQQTAPDEAMGEIKIFGSNQTIHWPLPTEIVEFRSSLKPRGDAMFFGALEDKKLPIAERRAIKALGGMEGDFRDWNAIEAWATEIGHELRLIAEHQNQTPPPEHADGAAV
ncbi:MAG: flavodoxin domain-containing protein [Ktedonobacterales bacterium]